MVPRGPPLLRVRRNGSAAPPGRREPAPDRGRCAPPGRAGTLRCRGEVAQLVEHTAENRGVAGSSPALAIPTIPGHVEVHAVKRGPRWYGRPRWTSRSCPRPSRPADQAARGLVERARRAVPRADRADRPAAERVRDRPPRRGASRRLGRRRGDHRGSVPRRPDRREGPRPRRRACARPTRRGRMRSTSRTSTPRWCAGSEKRDSSSSARRTRRSSGRPPSRSPS